MALENIDVLRIDTKEDVNNLRELKAEIKELKETLEQLEIGSEDYEKVADRLYNKQQYLAEVMRDTKRPVEDAAGSYNALNKQLTELRKTYRALSEEQRESDFGTDILLQIQDLDAKLKASDAQMGQYFRNVGNYTNSIIDAFNQMGISVTSLTAPLKDIGINIKSVDTGIKLLQGSFKTFSGQNLAALQQMLVSVTAGTKAFIASLSGIQKALLATGIGAFVVLLGVLIAHWDEWVGVTDDETEALNRANSILKDLNDTLTDEDRLLAYHIEMKKIQGASESEILDYELEELKRLRDLALEKANEIQANMLLITSEDELAQARKAHSEAMDKYNGYSAKIQQNYLNQSLALERQRQKASQEAARKAAEAEREREKIYAEAEKEAMALIDEEMKKLDEAIKIRQDAEEEQKSATQKEIEEYEKAKKKLEEWGIDTEALTANHNKRMAELRAEDAENHYNSEMAKLEFEEQMRQEKLAQENASKSEEENPWNYDQIVEQNNAEFEAYKALNEGKIALNEELMKNYEENSEEYKALQRENALLTEQISTAQAERDQKNSDAYKKLMKAREEATKSMATTTSNLFKNLSAAMGESTKMGKGFAIAAATIDTIAAAVAGFRAGFSQWENAGAMAWMAPVQAAINAAAALAAGYAQVQKIASVDTSGSVTSGGGMATALAMPNIEGLSSPVDYTRQVTTQTEQEEMNRDQRVYILESDIQESNTRVKVREEETTF